MNNIQLTAGEELNEALISLVLTERPDLTRTQLLTAIEAMATEYLAEHP